MLSLEAIRELNEKATKRSHRRGFKPKVFYDEESVNFDSIREIPFIGYREPEGWEKMDGLEGYEEYPLFIDTSEFGDDGEPALSVSRLASKLRATLAKEGKNWDGHLGFGLIEAGEFQGYLSVFRKKASGRGAHVPDEAA